MTSNSPFGSGKAKHGADVKAFFISLNAVCILSVHSIGRRLDEEAFCVASVKGNAIREKLEINFR